MKMPNMFTKVAGAIATSVILAGAPGTAQAQQNNETQRVSVEDYAARFNRLSESNAQQINMRLKRMGLSEIVIGEVVQPSKCIGVQFGVFLKKDKTHLFDQQCGNQTFENRYEFEEKFLTKIIQSVENNSNIGNNANSVQSSNYMQFSIGEKNNTVENKQNNSKLVEVVEVITLKDIRIEVGAKKLMADYGLTLVKVEEEHLGKKFSTFCFKVLESDETERLCFTDTTKKVEIRSVGNNIEVDVFNKNNTRQNTKVIPRFYKNTKNLEELEFKIGEEK